MFYKIPTCPLCKSKNFINFSSIKKNLYSQILSQITQQNEKKLLNKIKNLKCRECNLVFKNYWFDKRILFKIYNKYVSNHPRGIDVGSKKFSKTGLIKEYENLKMNLENKNFHEVDKYGRSIKSILMSIPNYNKNKLIVSILGNNSRVFDAKLDLQKLRKNLNEVSDLVNKPIEFKRFSGFDSAFLWKFLNKKKIKSYAEIGCPNWGLLKKSRLNKVKTFFINRKEENYWNNNCKINNQSCLVSCQKKFKFKILNFKHIKEKIDLIGVFEYLDHLKDPKNFIEKLFKISKRQAIILDNFEKIDQQVYIQHFSGWNKKVFNWIGKNYKKKIDTSFSRILKSENILFYINEKN